MALERRSPPGYLTAAETAAQLGISVTTLRRWIQRDWITPASVLGRSYLFELYVVERLRSLRRRE